MFLLLLPSRLLTTTARHPLAINVVHLLWRCGSVAGFPVQAALQVKQAVRQLCLMCSMLLSCPCNPSFTGCKPSPACDSLVRDLLSQWRSSPALGMLQPLYPNRELQLSQCAPPLPGTSTNTQI